MLVVAEMYKQAQYAATLVQSRIAFSPVAEVVTSRVPVASTDAISSSASVSGGDLARAHDGQPVRAHR